MLRLELPTNRSGTSVVQSAISIKAWQRRAPTVEEARPARCPGCGAPSHPVGAPLRLHGHGTRERQVWGPSTPEGSATIVGIVARRYRCVSCGAVLIVVPREVHGRRGYSVSAIGLALALWGLMQATAAQVRRRVCPATVLGEDAVTGWATLRRWARAVARGHLFSSTPGLSPSASLRHVAAVAASALAASANAATRELALEHRAFLGAAQAA